MFHITSSRKLYAKLKVNGKFLLFSLSLWGGEMGSSQVLIGLYEIVHKFILRSKTREKTKAYFILNLTLKSFNFHFIPQFNFSREKFLLTNKWRRDFRFLFLFPFYHIWFFNLTIQEMRALKSCSYLSIYPISCPLSVLPYHSSPQFLI